MPERIPDFQPDPRFPEPRPSVELHVIDWEISDFSDLIHQRTASLGPRLNRRCRYLNPLYTVSSPVPTAAFYRKAIWARAGWIKRFRKTIRPRGLHALLKQHTTSQRQLQISGVMYIHGFVKSPVEWAKLAEVSFNPDLANLSESRRSIKVADLLTSEGRRIFSDISREELRQHARCSPNAVLYVNPSLSLFAPRLTPTFLAKAREAENHWHGRLHRCLGKATKAWIEDANRTTKMLVFHGVLATHGRAYLLGHWPDKNTLEANWDSPPPLKDTISFEDLGLSQIDGA